MRDAKKRIFEYMKDQMPRHYEHITTMQMTDDWDMVDVPGCGPRRYLELCTRASMWYTEVCTFKAAPTLCRILISTKIN